MSCKFVMFKIQLIDSGNHYGQHCLLFCPNCENLVNPMALLVCITWAGYCIFEFFRLALFDIPMDVSIKFLGTFRIPLENFASGWRLGFEHSLQNAVLILESWHCCPPSSVIFFIANAPSCTTLANYDLVLGLPCRTVSKTETHLIFLVFKMPQILYV